MAMEENKDETIGQGKEIAPRPQCQSRWASSLQGLRGT